MRPLGYGIQYASARATPELVGRGEILDRIGKAIVEKSDQAQVFYITAQEAWTRACSGSGETMGERE